METSLQKIIAAIVGVLIFFIIPVYIAFEKVDDVSYSMAVKLTRNFVETVRNKGYISPEMYTDYVAGLHATNNSYDVKIEHVKKRYDPAIYIYDSEGVAVRVLDYKTYLNDDGTLPDEIVVDETTYTTSDYTFEISHTINEEIITDEQIVSRLFKDTGITKIDFLRQCLLGNTDMYNTLTYVNENSYVMNEGDKINVTVKNKNQTIASVFYSTITANVGLDEVAKIYVNYGGTIRNSGDTILNEDNGSVTSEYGRIFKYKGEAEEITLSEGTYQIEAWGASGGGVETGSGFTGGKGAYAMGVFDIEEETTLYIYVGGQGSMYSEANKENGGYNGGGNSHNGYGGGGASDVRLLKGEWDETQSLLSRIVVAAGGGSSSKANDSGEYGNGGYAGNATSAGSGKPSTSSYEGKGANYNNISVGYDTYTSSNPVFEGMANVSVDVKEKGSLGKGGSVDFDGSGAGGSGYFGGSASHDQEAGGGGGLSYVYSNIKKKSSETNKFYPALQVVANTYYTEFDAEPLKSLLENGLWKSVKLNEDVAESYLIKAGNEDMRNALQYRNNSLINGNKGNGLIIIKKIEVD